jgi:hypothetical protein
MQGMMQPRLQRVMNATDNVFLFDVDRRPFCPHFRRSLSVAVATTRARFCGTRWLCWQSAANRSPVVKSLITGKIQGISSLWGPSRLARPLVDNRLAAIFPNGENRECHRQNRESFLRSREPRIDG